MNERNFEAEEWLSRAEMIHLANVHAFHAYIAETEDLAPDHESARLRDVVPVKVVVIRDGPGD